jgi:hypothetical protein
MTFYLIKLPSYDTFIPSISQRDGQQRKNFFFPFLPPLQITKIHLYPPKVGAKMEKKKKKKQKTKQDKTKTKQKNKISLSINHPFD